MKVLIVHSAYRSSVPSGENAVVASQREWLCERGHDVVEVSANSDRLLLDGVAAKAVPALRILRGAGEKASVIDAVTSLDPDIIHLHNPFPSFPYALFRDAAIRVPVVQTIHNYRLSCLRGDRYRDGSICSACVDGSQFNGVRYRCRDDSFLASAAMHALMERDRRNADVVRFFLPVSARLERGLVEIGIEPQRIRRLSNAVPAPQETPSVSPAIKSVAYIGRLSEGKGIRLLLDSWAHEPELPNLTIAGDGPLRVLVNDRAQLDARIDFRGRCDQGQLADIRAESSLVVVPSLWLEGAPLTVLEAFAAARPVVAISVSGASDLINADVGWIAPPSPFELAACILAALRDPSLSAKGVRARLAYDEQYAPGPVMDALEAIYREAIDA
jgi:glycosyltransferase involved in cell wall biosynthesis